ncbi:hypothetical protein C1H46_005199 [Malus baccata]|uniref:Uncharacterized protein n=1 Tax=Malus baccata TaxID=106549 RepID=A0A540NDZ1_MALBA|nr:hypothetical protein C1H46_005199 [Malus baccata]
MAKDTESQTAMSKSKPTQFFWDIPPIPPKTPNFFRHRKKESNRKTTFYETTMANHKTPNLREQREIDEKWRRSSLN